MKNVVYICNYMLEDVINRRSNSRVYSQAANNKISGIVKCLEQNNCKVKIISNGLVNNRTLKYYKKFISSKDKKVTYAGIIDFPILSTISSIVSIVNHIRVSKKNENIDYIIFYNYKPETAIAAWLCKVFYKIPIVLDYEDGYFAINEISNIKRHIINLIEKKVSKNIDGAILVTSILKDRVSCNYVVVRGLTNEKILTSKKSENKNKIPIVMYSGGLEKIRGIEVLLESLNFTRSKFKLLISGKGDCEELVKQYSDERIQFLGYINYEDVIDYMINSDMLINCQLSNNQFGEASFPSKIFEYASTTNIIISSDVSDIDEFIGQVIHLYRDDNPEELAKKIDEIISNLDDPIFRYQEKEKMHSFATNNTPENIGKLIIDKLF